MNGNHLLAIAVTRLDVSKSTAHVESEWTPKIWSEVTWADIFPTAPGDSYLNMPSRQSDNGIKKRPESPS